MIRDIAPGDIAGEIRQNPYKVNLSVFYKTLEIQTYNTRIFTHLQRMSVWKCHLKLKTLL